MEDNMSKIINLIRNISPFNNRTEMPKLLYVIKVVIIFWAFKFASELVGEAIVLAVHFACGKNPLEGEMFDPKTIMLMTYFGYAFIIGVIFLLWKLFQKKTVKELGFTGRPSGFLAGAAIGAVIVVICAVAVIITGSVRFNGVLENIDVKMVAAMLICFILQSSMEEILCRGVVHQLLINKTPVPVTIGVSAVLFTIPHLSSMAGGPPVIVSAAIVNTVLVSVIFSLITIRSGSIWAACGLHSIWNYILYSILGLNLSGNDEIAASVFDLTSVGSNVLNGGEYGIEAGIMTTVVLAAALVVIRGRRAIGFDQAIRRSGDQAVG